MKKKLLVMVITCIFTLSSYAGAQYIEQFNMEKNLDSFEGTITKRIDSISENKNLQNILLSQGKYPDEIARTMDLYLDIISKYSIDDTLLNLMFTKAESGWNMEHMLEIYQFIFNGDKDFSKLEKMYELGMESNFNGYWLESVYCAASDEEIVTLNVEDVYNYIDQGLTVRDISLANKLCFKKIKNIKEILDEKIQGKEWNEIIAEIYNDSSLASGTFTEESGDVILNVARKSEIYNISSKNIYDANTTDKLTEKVSQTESQINNIISDVESTYNFNVDPENILQLAKEKIPEIEESTLQYYIDEGYLIRELEKAYEISQRDNISFDIALSSEEV